MKQKCKSMKTKGQSTKLVGYLVKFTQDFFRVVLKFDSDKKKVTLGIWEIVQL